MRPVLNGIPSVLTKNSSKAPPTVMIPGTTPYRMAATMTNEIQRAMSEPFRLAFGYLL